MELNSITFCEDSKLKKIDKKAFSFCPIESIFILSSADTIGEKAFYECSNLKSIQNFENSQIQKIEDLTFSTNKIESLSIPYNLIELKEL